MPDKILSVKTAENNRRIDVERQTAYGVHETFTIRITNDGISVQRSTDGSSVITIRPESLNTILIS